MAPYCCWRFAMSGNRKAGKIQKTDGAGQAPETNVPKKTCRGVPRCVIQVLSSKSDCKLARR
jgi:hypothetical protein